MSNNLQIVVDPRIELLMTVQIISDYGEVLKKRIGTDPMQQSDKEYKKRIMEHFGCYSNCDPVKVTETMASNGFWLGMPVEAVLHLSEPPELKLVHPHNPFVIERANGAGNLELFVESLREFARETHYMDFYNDNKDFYDEVVSQVRSLFSVDYNNTGMLEDYYGVAQNSYQIIVAPLSQGCYGPSIQDNLYYVCGIGEVDFNSPAHRDSMNYNFWHEFSHPVINPLIENLQDTVRQIQQTANLVQHADNDMAFWNEYLCEHIIRAVTVRFAYKYMGKDKGDRFLAKEVREGFKYIPAICRKLEVYENNRKQYAAFSEYVLEILKVFTTDLL